MKSLFPLRAPGFAQPDARATPSPVARVVATWGTALLVACVVGKVGAEGNPYSDVIVTRNVFGLKEPPPPPPPPDTTPPAPKLTLVGIANVFGVKKAVIKTQPAPGTPPKAAVPGAPPPAQEPPLVLVEDQTLEGVHLISIDEAAGAVKVENNGVAMTLTFDKDGLKVPTGPAAPAGMPPGVPGQIGQPGIPRPPGMPGVAPGMATPMPGTVTVNVPQTGPVTLPAGMSEEMRKRFAERYGVQIPAGTAPPYPNAIPSVAPR